MAQSQVAIQMSGEGLTRNSEVQVAAPPEAPTDRQPSSCRETSDVEFLGEINNFLMSVDGTAAVQMIMVGTQSVGKTSLVEAALGGLPLGVVGKGRATVCPVMYDISHQDSMDEFADLVELISVGTKTYTYRVCYQAPGMDVPENVMPDTCVKKLHLHMDTVSKTRRGMSADAFRIFLQTDDPDCVTMTFADMPGLIVVGSSGGEADDGQPCLRDGLRDLTVDWLSRSETNIVNSVDNPSNAGSDVSTTFGGIIDLSDGDKYKSEVSVVLTHLDAHLTSDDAQAIDVADRCAALEHHLNEAGGGKRKASAQLKASLFWLALHQTSQQDREASFAERAVAIKERLRKVQASIQEKLLALQPHVLKEPERYPLLLALIQEKRYSVGAYLAYQQKQMLRVLMQKWAPVEAKLRKSMPAMSDRAPSEMKVELLVAVKDAYQKTWHSGTTAIEGRSYSQEMGTKDFGQLLPKNHDQPWTQGFLRLTRLMNALELNLLNLHESQEITEAELNSMIGTSHSLHSSDKSNAVGLLLQRSLLDAHRICVHVVAQCTEALWEDHVECALAEMRAEEFDYMSETLSLGLREVLRAHLRPFRARMEEDLSERLADVRSSVCIDDLDCASLSSKVDSILFHQESSGYQVVYKKQPEIDELLRQLGQLLSEEKALRLGGSDNSVPAWSTARWFTEQDVEVARLMLSQLFEQETKACRMAYPYRLPFLLPVIYDPTPSIPSQHILVSRRSRPPGWSSSTPCTGRPTGCCAPCAPWCTARRPRRSRSSWTRSHSKWRSRRRSCGSPKSCASACRARWWRRDMQSKMVET